MEEKYKNWSKILIEPNAMNVARVYCLEARVGDEERSRLQESKFLQENLLKLTYSIDQLNAQKLNE